MLVFDLPADHAEGSARAIVSRSGTYRFFWSKRNKLLFIIKKGSRHGFS